jgi:putative peptidoglycan lipid II flippase
MLRAVADASSEGGRSSRRRFRVGGSLAVGAGILFSRAAGLVRQSVFAYYFGNSDAADAFQASFRIPNLLQNLFGEGALSASMIPVYARLHARGEGAEAARVARAVATVLTLLVSLAVLGGVLATPLLIALIAPGFQGEKRDATIQLVQIFFPGAGLLVLSAWCLGVLNSHRRFFLSYFAPVVWSVSIVATLLLFGRRGAGYPLAEWAAWGSVVGSGLQLLVQLPVVLRLLGSLRPSFGRGSAHVREVFRNFVPVAFSRGVVQVSAYVDQVIASFLPSGAVAALAYAQVLYTLPVSLFGMAVSAAELPEMSSALGTEEEVRTALRSRVQRALGRIAFFVVPSAAALFALGDVLAALLFQRGRFGYADTVYVWAVLAGSAVGLLAATTARLYSSAFYALQDTRTPLRFAALRVTVGAALGYTAALPLPRALGVDPSWGTVALTASASLAAWLEFALLRASLRRRLGSLGLGGGKLAKLWLAAAVAVAAGWSVKLALSGFSHAPLLRSPAVVAAYGLAYLGTAALLRVEECREFVFRLRGR